MTDWSADKVQQKGVNSLIPYDRNPNTHPDSQIERLANSIREWGWTVPIIIDENDMVLAGHGRLFAAQKLNMETVPCVIVEGWTESQKKAYVIADNKLAEGSEWNSELYFSELKDISDSGFDLDLVGFDESMASTFSPNITPSTQFGDISEDDVNKAAQNLDSRIAGLSAEKSLTATEVMCPHCAETFSFSGY